VNHDFHAAIVEDAAHRPWPMPHRPWVMTQTWHDLLFAHWRADPSHLRAKIPPAFELDLFEGEAWVGVVPFRMTNVAPRGVPSLPWMSEFAEMNVRTYVRAGGKPGVYFFSLDAASVVAVETARALLNLPYYAASMSVAGRGDAVEYDSCRSGGEPAADFQATYRPTGPPSNATPGSLSYFLTERYCLYNVGRFGRPYRLEIHHPPWPLQPAEANLVRNTMASANGVVLAPEPPLLHFARRQDVVAWAPSAISSAGS
jgi:uncharacterized protein YqjF (DUF2071 family)